MIVPGLTRAGHAFVLDALRHITQLSEEAVTAAFMDADRGRLTIGNTSKAIGQQAYRAAAYGATRGGPLSHPVAAQRVATDIAAAHGLSPEVAGIILGAATGLRLGLDVRRRPTKQIRPALAIRVAQFDWKPESDIEAAKRWTREMGRVAAKSERRRKRR